jgi:competence protein ComEA
MPDSPRTDTVDRDAPDSEFWKTPDRPGRSPAYAVRPTEWGSPFERLVDRVRDLRGDPRVGIAALLVVALVVGFVWYRLGSSDAGESSRTTRQPASATTATSATSATSGTASDAKNGGKVTVHVAGAVIKPGVYELDADARVIDAVESAGGGVPDADLNRLNLAAKVADGQRVLVQRVGEAAAAPGAPGGSASADATALINLNSATPAELEALPGIGPTLAGAIIAERERRGGFRSVNELRDVRGIGEKRFADLKDKVTI